MTKKVEKITREELNNAKNQNNGTIVPNVSAARQYPVCETSKYIGKLSDASIKGAFSKFGLLYMDRITHPDGIGDYIYVVCNNFEAMFDDYTFNICFGDFRDMIDGNINFFGEEVDNSFDIDAFSEYCQSLNVAPDGLIEETIISKLFSGSKYAEDRKSYKLKNSKRSFEKLPRNMQKLFKNAHEKVESGIKATYNKTKYGNYNIEDFITTNYNRNN